MFLAYHLGEDIAVKQARQTGKTMLTSIWLAYQIMRNRARIVIISTKMQKTKKIAKKILQALKRCGEKLTEDSFVETRCPDEAGFICMSGQPDAEREGETADIVFVDEMQDIDFEAVYEDVSPMRAATGGIIISAGIGGIAVSFGETMFDNKDVVKVLVTWREVALEREQHAWIAKWLRTMEKDRKIMDQATFEAHYEGRRLPANKVAWLPYLISWDEVYPDYKFDPFQCKRAVVGLDWGRRTDFSALVGLALMPQKMDLVMYGFGKYDGMGYAEQLEGVNNDLASIPYHYISSETNNIGDVLTEFLRKKLKAEARALKEFYTDAEMKKNTVQHLNFMSVTKRLLFVDDGRWALDAVEDLVRVGVKYTATGGMKITHSDWASALIAATYELVGIGNWGEGVDEDA